MRWPGSGQRPIQVFHGKGWVEPSEAGDAEFSYSAGNDAVKVIKGWIKVDRDAVPADPSADPDAKRSDLGFFACKRIKGPDADASFSRKSRYTEVSEGLNDPGFKSFDERAKILGRYRAVLVAEIQENVSQSLTWPMIRPLTATACLISRIVMWIIEILLLCRRSGRKDGGMLYKPDDGIGCSLVDLARASGHEVQSIRVRR